MYKSLRVMNYISLWCWQDFVSSNDLSRGWEQFRRLWKNRERKLNSSLQMIRLAFISVWRS